MNFELSLLYVYYLVCQMVYMITKLLLCVDFFSSLIARDKRIPLVSFTGSCAAS